MSVFMLKLIAVVSMFVDHLTYVLYLSGRLPFGTQYIIGRAIGRPAFVIYCFLLVNGFDKTRDRKKYFSRLVMFAVLSQLPFNLAFTDGNYRGVIETVFSFDPMRAHVLLLPLLVYFLTVCRRRFDPSLLWLTAAFLFASMRMSVSGITLLEQDDLNVFYTLAAAFAVMMALDYLRSGERNRLYVFLILAALAVELCYVEPHADYALKGVALIAGLYLCRNRRRLQLIVAALGCFVEYYWCFFAFRQYFPLMIGALSALLPIALYSGKLGPKTRTFFYVFYPAHLALLGAVFVYLSRA